MRIAEVVAAKPSGEVHTVEASASVRELLEVMAARNVGALVVSADGSHVEGIVSERDVVRRLTGGADLLDATVGDIMTTTVRTCAPRDDVEQVMELMTESRIRHVPVVDDDVLVGLVSIGDVVKSRIGQLKFERDQLDEYVRQGGV